MTTENIENSYKASSDSSNKQEYWQDVHQKALPAEMLKNEFKEGEFDSFSVEKSRRNFLKIMGFSVSALPLASCIKIPVKKAVPYLLKNDTIIPGVANWYATTFSGCTNGCHLLVKTREGRPIKVEGNDKSSFSKGATCTTCQGSVLSLYDGYRYTSAELSGKKVEWSALDQSLLKAFESAKNNGEEIVIVTPTIKSPSSLAVINKFKKHYGKVTHVPYDAVSRAAIVSANEKTHGVSTITEFNIKSADLVVSFDADFLGTWISPIQMTKDYSSRRDLSVSKNMLRHIQVEGSMSLSGTNADTRYPKNIKDQRNILLGILKGLTGEGLASTSSNNKEAVLAVLAELRANRGRSLVISGDNDINTQVIVNKINSALGNYGKTLNVFSSKYHKFADDQAFEAMLSRATAGKISGIIFWDANPVYSYYNKQKIETALSKIKTRVSFASAADETSVLCNYIAPANHSFESWGDVLTTNNELAFIQPVIQPLFGSRQATETLLVLAGSNVKFYDFMKSFWKSEVFPKQGAVSFTKFWDKSLHDGVVKVKGMASYSNKKVGPVEVAARSLASEKYGEGNNIAIYEKIAIRDGSLANNPWLQEVPDPVTKACWDNYAQIGPSLSKKLGIKTDDEVEVSNGSYKVRLPALVQAGLVGDTVAIAAGYGRSVAGKVAKDLGANAFGFSTYRNGTFQYTGQSLEIKKTGKKSPIAHTQTHHSMEGRDIVRETTLDKFLTNPKAGNKPKVHLISMWGKHSMEGHQWAMSVDLNKCTGCSGCIVSCNAENNIPVVGKEEVLLRRELHWMRIDRYYKGDEENPETVHQVMNCQHCDNAPCETVCPVIATAQSSDGLNMQIYNRCVGTRYCANNCPYKVRRFNWFEYPRNDLNENMVLNPDVVVRKRGTMEKCSMCIQRIQEAKLTAKKAGRPLKDGDIKLACQQSCPGDAIVFGDMNDPKSKISKHLKNERNYTVLEELNVRPRVSYLTKVRNK